MVRKLLTFVLVIGILSAALPLFGLAGATPGAFSFNASCTQLIISYGAYTYDRDNTGAGYEFYRFSAIDGDGTTLESGLSYGVVGSGGVAHTDDHIDFTIAAGNYNPIHIQMVSLSGNGYGEQTVWDFNGECDGLPTYSVPGGLPGPGARAPSFFVHRQLVCETPGYNLPAGQPVNGVNFHNGQTWFVNPIPVEDYNGDLWTEVFDSSPQYPFIPWECVNPDAAAVIIKPNLPLS